MGCAAGPTAAGFALAAEYLRPKAVAIAFFGDAAMNQGVLMESMNLASVWSLPVLFVCKDDGWGVSVDYARVCTRTTIPYARHLEDQTLPNVERICAQARKLM